MYASIVDLRYKMKDVLQALKRNECVKVLYRGKTSGILMPVSNSKTRKKIHDHPFFGMHEKNIQSVSEEMGQLRGGRYKDVEDAI